MKKVTLLIAMAALVMLVGCKKENDTKGVTLKASIGQNKGNDRTSLNPSNGAINWTAGDKILVNNGTSSVPFTLTEGAGTTYGTFVYGGDYEFGTNNVAVYPETATINGNMVRITLPETQTFTATGTFGNGANPMLGTFTDPDDINFTSLCGGLCISLKTYENEPIPPLKRIEIRSKAPGDKLNGTFETDCTAANPILTPTADNTGTDRIVLNCNITLTPTPQDFFFVLPVGTLSQGIEFTFIGEDGGSYILSTMQSPVIEPNTVKKLPPISVFYF